jgi:hypothetical protein
MSLLRFIKNFLIFKFKIKEVENGFLYAKTWSPMDEEKSVDACRLPI